MVDVGKHVADQDAVLVLDHRRARRDAHVGEFAERHGRAWLTPLLHQVGRRGQAAHRRRREARWCAARAYSDLSAASSHGSHATAGAGRTRCDHAVGLGIGAGAGIGAAEIGDAARRLHWHENATKCLRIRSLVGIAKVDGEARASGDRRRDRHASDRRFDDVLDVAHRETVACDRLAVRDDIDVLAAGLPLGERAARARHLAQHAFERHADALDLLQILAED